MKYWITSTLILLGVSVFFWNKSYTLEQNQKELPGLITKSMMVMAEVSCESTIQYMCSTQTKCSLEIVEDTLAFCKTIVR